MPAEWEEHAATWIAWPHNEKDWPGKFAPVPWVFAEIVRILAPGERVHILVEPSRDHRARSEAAEILEKADVNLSHVTFHEVPTNRVWLRDSGGIFVRQPDGTLAINDFTFNAWAKYPDYALDDAIPAAMADFLHLTRVQATAQKAPKAGRRFVLEGGSIDGNGKGTLLTTEECLLSKIQQRNPGLSRDQIEQTLSTFLGVKKILWLKSGIAGDDTHGHIDDTARFVNDHTIVACIEPDRRDENHARLHDNWKRLARMSNAGGKRITAVELPMPDPIYFDGTRLPASYANFYIANAAVLVPVFNDRNDARALNILEQCFKGRPIIPVYCRDLVWGLGTIHCLTQQQPAP
jgi:agmatine deiminase